MDNPGDDYPLRGRGAGPPNLYSSDLRGMAQIDPQLAAALDFEELRLRRQLELQQDIELRRRILEEHQHHQIMSELDYRHQIQQLQQLQAQQQAQAQHQAHQQQQQHHQQQQISLNQLLAQNPHLLEELQHHQQLQRQQQQQQAQQHAQQQFHISQRSQLPMGGDGGRGGPGSEEYEFLRRQVMLQQEMQQRFHESQQQQQQQHRQQREQQQRQQHQQQQKQQRQQPEQLLHSSNSPMLAAMLNASQNGNSLLSVENSLCRDGETNESLARQMHHHQQLQQELKHQQQKLEQQKLAAEQQQQHELRSMPPAPAAPTPVQQEQSNTPEHYSPSTLLASSPKNIQRIAAPPSDPQASLSKDLAPKVKASVSGDSPMKSSPQDSRKKKRSQSEATNNTEASEDSPLVSTKTTNKRMKINGKPSKHSPQSKEYPSKSLLDSSMKVTASENYLEEKKLNLHAALVMKEEQVRDVAEKHAECDNIKLKTERGDNDKTFSSVSINAAKPTAFEDKKDVPSSKKAKKKKSLKEPVDGQNAADTHATANSSDMKKKSKTSSRQTPQVETKSKDTKTSPSSREFNTSKKSDELSSSKESKDALIGSSHVVDPLTDHEKSLIRHLMVHEDGNISGHLDDSSKKSMSKETREGFPSSKQQHKKNRFDEETSGMIEKKSMQSDDAKDDLAADILLKFKFVDVTAQEAEDAKIWNDQIPPKYVKYVVPTESPMLTDTLKFNLPSLPIEPEYSHFESTCLSGKNLTCSLNEVGGKSIGDQLGSKSLPASSTAQSTSTTWPISLSKPRKVYAPQKNDHDKWWPSHSAIRRERRMRDQPSDLEDTDEEIDEDSNPSFAKASVEDLKKRMANSAEPGVLEKIPHCRLYEEYCAKKYGLDSMPEPKFCCQVAEHFLNDIMVCCSICSTWRHAQCGGHYKHYSPNSVDPSDLLFEPICDQCFMEQSIVKEYENPTFTKRLDRQRIEHLRKTNATNAVMRQAAFAKHSGQYKWPLGSVTASHITGHTRSVQGRHDKAEKQWGEMASRLNGEVAFRPKERVKVRTRELEKLLVHVEDAEGVTDRHNMILFLERDTSKPQPAGFEGFRRNIFDPEDDVIVASPSPDTNAANKSPLNGKNRDKTQSTTATVVSPVIQVSASNKEDYKTTSAMEFDAFVSKNGKKSQLKKHSSKKNESKSQYNETSIKGKSLCARRGCKKHPRFDSIFCSDACGVSALEFDLLRSLQYASEAHPSVLRA